jgi:hypothetical protein
MAAFAAAMAASARDCAAAAADWALEAMVLTSASCSVVAQPPAIARTAAMTPAFKSVLFIIRSPKVF